MRLGIHDTEASDLGGEVILVRECKIEHAGEVSPLSLNFLRPKQIGGYDAVGSLRFECKHFDRTLTVVGGDGVQVLCLLFTVGKSCLQLIQEDDFTIWWNEKGDFDFLDFWSYQPKPTEYCLQSAYQDAASEAFTQETKGKFLMPSHRVAIELDRPGITTYAVRPDGSDHVEGLIGADEMKGISPAELCRRLGQMILTSTEEGRALLDRRRESGDYPTNARSST